MTPDEEKWTLDVAREALHDMGETEHATYRINNHMGRCVANQKALPMLVVVFDHPEAAMVPALGILLANPATGDRFKDDTIRRAIRNGMEKYLKECGVPPKPALADWRGWARPPR